MRHSEDRDNPAVDYIPYDLLPAHIALPEIVSPSLNLIESSDPEVHGTERNDHIIGTATEYPQTLYGYGGNDILELPVTGGTAYGGDGDDVLVGAGATGDGSDPLFREWQWVSNALYGGNGNDTLIGGSADAARVFNYLDGGLGLDTLIGGTATNGGYVENVFRLEDLDTGDRVQGGGSGTFNSLQTYGTSGDDNLLITPEGWTLNGSVLDITGIDGLTYAAGDGSDVVDAGRSGLARVSLDGGDGNDTLIGASATGDGSGGGVFLMADSGWGRFNNSLSGGNGDDTVVGGNADGTWAANHLSGGLGRDSLTGGVASNGGYVDNVFVLDDLNVGDSVTGGGLGSWNSLSASGTSREDHLVITTEAWTLDGAGLNITGIQRFTYAAGDGGDTVDASRSGLAAVMVSGGAGEDVLTGAAGIGESGGEVRAADLGGGSVHNELTGGEGADTVIGGGTAGGYVFNRLAGDAQGATLPRLESAEWSFDGEPTLDTAEISGNDVLIGGSTDSGTVFNHLDGGFGRDTLIGGKVSLAGRIEETVSLTGHVANHFYLGDLDTGDRVHGGGIQTVNTLRAAGSELNDDLMITGDRFGFDERYTGWSLNGVELDIRGIQEFTYFAAAGNDNVDASRSGFKATAFDGGLGNDVLVGAHGVGLADSFLRDAGFETASFRNTLRGGEGNDVLVGGNATDAHVYNHLDGGTGSDGLSAARLAVPIFSTTRAMSKTTFIWMIWTPAIASAAAAKAPSTPCTPMAPAGPTRFSWGSTVGL